MDSVIGVGRNWSSDSAASCVKTDANSQAIVAMRSRSTRRGWRKASISGLARGTIGKAISGVEMVFPNLVADCRSIYLICCFVDIDMLM